MKHFITTILLLATCIIGYSQITLDHTFTPSSSLNSFISNSHGLMFYEESIDTTTNSFNIYNSDYTIYKTATLSRPVGAYGVIYLCSEKLFNTDNLLEFICVYQMKDYSEKIIAYNENGTELKNFGSTYFSLNTPQIISYNSTSKLIFNYYKNNNHVYEIYSLPGSLPNQVSELKLSSIKSAFPSPSNSTITIPYSISTEQANLKVFDTNGNEITNKTISSSNSEINLDIQSYKPGLYIYEYNGKSGKFIKN